MSGIPPPHPPTRVLFVGNIPYELTEEQILDVLNPIAPVQRFNLIADKNAPAAGRSKGYGFAEYSDIDTATFALNKIVQIHLGTRALRAAYSEDRSAPGGSNFGPPSRENTSTPPKFNRPPYQPNQPQGMMNQGPSGYNNQSQGPGQGGYNPYGQSQYQQQQQQRQNQYPNQQNQPHQYQNQNQNQMYNNGPMAANPPVPVTPTPPPLLVASDAVSQNLASFEPEQLLDALQNFKQLVATNPQQAHEVLRNAPPQLTHALVQSMLLMGFIDTNVISKAVPTAQQATVPPSTQAQNAPFYSTAPATPLPSDPQKALIVKQVLDLTDEQIHSLPVDQRTTILQLRDNYRRGIF